MVKFIGKGSMKIKVEVYDSRKNESYFEVEAENKSEARMIARNLHIMKCVNEGKYFKDFSKLPEIYTQIEE